MPLVLADRVRETTTTTGTGTISLAGPVSGFQGFSTAIGNANTTYYTIVDSVTGAWEVGLGTYTSSGSTLARTTVLSSSNSDALVPFGVGTKDVFVTQPAERAVYILGAGTGLAAGAAAFTANGVPYASATNTLTTGSALTFDGSQLAVNAASGGINMLVSSAGNTGLRVVGGTGAGLGSYFSLQSQGANSALIGTESAISGGTSNNLWLYGYGSNSIVMAPATAEVARFTSTGLGIGITNPANKLVVSNAGAAGFEFDPANGIMQTYNRSGGAYSAAKVYASNFEVRTGSSPAAGTFFIDASGNVGIGTNSPSTKLEVSVADATNAQRWIATTGRLRLRPYVDATSGAIFESTNTAESAYLPLSLYGSSVRLGNGAQVIIDSSGNLGLGTTPGTSLDVYRATGNSIIRAWAASGIPRFDLRSASRYYSVSIQSDNLTFFDETAGSTRMTLDSSGNLGIGTSSPNAKLSFADATGQKIRFYNALSGYGIGVESSEFRFVTDNSAIFTWGVGTYASPTERMRLDTSGNLGLGVTPSTWSQGRAMEFINPGYGFWNGSGSPASMYMLANAYFNSGFKYGGTGQASSYYQYQGAHVWSTAVSGSVGDPITFSQAMTLTSGGSLLIGQAATVTNEYFRVSGSGQASMLLDNTGKTNGAFVGSFNDAALFGVNRNPSTGVFYNASNRATDIVLVGSSTESYIVFETATAANTTPTERARIDSGGNFGVARGTGGDTTVGATLYADGTVTCARSSSSNSDLNLYVYSTGAAAARFYVGMGGTVYATSTTITAISDQRLKENIQDIDVGLDAIMALKPRKFDWKAGKGKDKKGDRGWIAQEFEQVFPDMVDTWADPAPEGEEPYKAVNADLIPVLVKALQELKAEFDAYKATHP